MEITKYKENNNNIKKIIKKKKSVSKDSFIYYDGYGRLGNLLFGIASTLGIAKMNNRCILFGPKLLEIKNIFPNLNISILRSYEWKKWLKIKEERALSFDTKFFKLPKRNVTISSYLQSFHYFKHLSSEIYQIFSNINNTILLKVRKFVAAITKKQEMSVHFPIPQLACLHVRRGDYLRKYNRNVGYKVASSKSIQFAINYIKSMYQNVIFIISSDDKNWCLEHLKHDGLYYSNFTSAVNDFILLLQCDHMIMTVGTFGWWPAWFTSQKGGAVLYYRQPFTRNTSLFNEFTLHDHFPDEWLGYNESSIVKTRNLIS